MNAALQSVCIVVAMVAAAVAARALVELVCRQIDGDLRGDRGRTLGRWN